MFHNLCDWMQLSAVFKLTAQRKNLSNVWIKERADLWQDDCVRKNECLPYVLFSVDISRLIPAHSFPLSLISRAGPHQQHLSFWLSLWWMDGNNITILSFTIFAHLLIAVKSFAVTPVHCGHFQKSFNSHEWLSHLCFVTFVLSMNSS